MQISKEELLNFRPQNSWVLIKPELISHNGEILSSGLMLPWQQFGNSPMCSVGVFGTIIKNPVSLYYDRDYMQESDPWKTEIETKEGDRVLYNYHAAYTALGKLVDSVNEESDPTYFICEGEVYMLLKYYNLILVKREEEIVMLNGYLLTIPMEEEKLSEIRRSLILPESLKGRTSLKYTKVFKIGSRNQEYLNECYCRDGNEIQEGDIVLYEENYNIECEFESYQKLDQKYYRIQRKNILAIVKHPITSVKDIQPL